MKLKETERWMNEKLAILICFLLGKPFLIISCGCDLFLRDQTAVKHVINILPEVKGVTRSIEGELPNCYTEAQHENTCNETNIFEARYFHLQLSSK